MINELKKQLLKSNLKHYKSIAIIYGELVMSADNFTGYELIQETMEIDKLIDKKLFKVQYLNNNIIKIKTKARVK
jgi:hypothetical protein